MNRKELLIGCGHNHDKRLCLHGHEKWEGLVTLDINQRLAPDICWDLTKLPYPMETDSCDEIHAYEVLEHTGRQGDYAFFFAQWSEFWRILKPGGTFFCTAPSPKSVWAWGDPSHSRTVQVENLPFLVQPEYVKQQGKTSMTDFRYMYSADFDVFAAEDDGEGVRFILSAVKPSRIAR